MKNTHHRTQEKDKTRMDIYQLQHLQVLKLEESSLGTDLFIQYWKKRGEVLQTEAKTTFSQVSSLFITPLPKG